MDISAGLIAKVLAGAAAASATVAGIVFKDKLGSLFYKSENADSNQSGQGPSHLPESTKLSKFDQALIDNLNSGLEFTSKPGDFSNNYGEEALKISLIVNINDQKHQSLKAINGNKDWTWECEIIFRREEGSSNASINDEEKNSFEGFLNKIKSSENNNNELKKKFIEGCGKTRGGKIDKALENLEDLNSWPQETKNTMQEGEEENVVQKDGKIKSEKEFTLVDDGEKLKIKGNEKNEFDQWFSVPN